jgi:undecaprenyl-diphosphatase
MIRAAKAGLVLLIALAALGGRGGFSSGAAASVPERLSAPDDSVAIAGDAARQAPDSLTGAAAPDRAGAEQVPLPCDTAETEAARKAPNESSLDVRLFRLLNGSAANPLFDAVMPLITDLDRWRVILIVIWSLLVLLGGKRGRWAAFMLIPLVAASDQISSHLFKPLIERVRPCEVLGGVHLWYGPVGWITTPAEVARSYKSSFSFPSGHAANITASMIFLGLVYRRWLVPLAVVALAVSYSRVYIGVHWPSDVAAGMALGGALAWPAYLLFKKAGGKDLSRPERGTPPSE